MGGLINSDELNVGGRIRVQGSRTQICNVWRVRIPKCGTPQRSDSQTRTPNVNDCYAACAVASIMWAALRRMRRSNHYVGRAQMHAP